MIDLHARRLINPLLDKISRFIVQKKITANNLTMIGFLFGLCCFISLMFQSYGFALFFLVLNRIMDGLDGTVARHSTAGATDLGAFLDIVTDFIFYAGFVFFFAVGRPECALPAAFLIFGFMGTASSFLSYAIIAAKRNLDVSKQNKSFYYLGGLTEGVETIFAFVLICVFSAYFTPIAVVFGLMCWLTTIGRVLQAFRDFKA